MKKWLDGFIIGDYYKITYMGNPSMFVIVRADERKTPTYTDEPYIKCTNVYDNDMGWTSKPHIYNIITNNTAYTIEHLTKGYVTETM